MEVSKSELRKSKYWKGKSKTFSYLFIENKYYKINNFPINQQYPAWKAKGENSIYNINNGT